MACWFHAIFNHIQKGTLHMTSKIVWIAVAVSLLTAGGRGTSALADESPDEVALIATLEGDSDWLAKQEACRALRRVGTAKAVPALEELLVDEKLSHMARFALESMSCDEASAALRHALPKASGLPKVGIVISLGARSDTEATPLLAALLHEQDGDLASAAAGALGRIATTDAVKALLDVSNAVGESVRLAVAEGLLAAGQRMTREGRGDEAAPVYEALLDAAWPEYVRMGAFRGLAYAQPQQAPERLIGALKGDAPSFRDLAAETIAETGDEASTKVYAAALPNLPVAGQVALLRGLAGRADTTARPAVAAALDNADTN
ncbi:MAG TPA: HEAT repeat domain-containing protein, partial [Candidatus Hydrogenedentes bacterium]|nr:HEAT repeat domain-containing protein [Candidatus Hydrogenedentota bacterium]